MTLLCKCESIQSSLNVLGLIYNNSFLKYSTLPSSDWKKWLIVPTPTHLTVLCLSYHLYKYILIDRQALVISGPPWILPQRKQPALTFGTPWANLEQTDSTSKWNHESFLELIKTHTPSPPSVRMCDTSYMYLSSQENPLYELFMNTSLMGCPATGTIHGCLVCVMWHHLVVCRGTIFILTITSFDHVSLCFISAAIWCCRRWPALLQHISPTK
jgi:hypothetical protein